MLCYRCGTENEEGDAVCLGCGLALEEASGAVGTIGEAEVGEPAQADEESGRVAELPFAVGDVIAERYQVKEIIAHGPHAAVLKVFDEEIEVDVALKLLDPRLTDGDEEREAVLAALRRAQQLSHQNIVRIFDADAVDGRVYYTTQCLEGLTLRKILQNRCEKRQIFTLLEVEPIVSQISQALHYAHRVLPHGLLKPENVFVLPDMVKVMDFGLGPGIGSQLVYAFAMERGAGGELYLPLAVRAGEPADEVTDVYAIGVMLGEMLTGERFTGEGAFDLVGLNPALPPAVSEVFDRAVGRDEEESYTSAFELAADLESVIDTGKVRSRGESGAVDTGDAPAPVPAPAVDDNAVTRVRSEGTQEISADMIVPDDGGDLVEPGEGLFETGGLDAPIVSTTEIGPDDIEDEDSLEQLAEPLEEATAPVSTGRAAALSAPSGTVPVRQSDGSVVNVPLATLSQLQPKRGGALTAVVILLAILLVGAAGGGVYFFLKWNEERGKPRPKEVVYKTVAADDDRRSPRDEDPRDDRVGDPRATAEPVATAEPDDGVTETASAGTGDRRDPDGTGKPDGDGKPGKGDRKVDDGSGKKGKGDRKVDDDGGKKGKGDRKVDDDGGKKGKPDEDDGKKGKPDEDGGKKGKPDEDVAVAAGPKTGTKCPKGMRLIKSKKGNYCIDIFEFPGKPKARPKASVDYGAAKDLCESASKRLCTVREWTMACMGKGGAKFPYGKKYSADMCVTEDSDGDDRRVLPSGSMKSCRSARGVYDMSGNVEEWVYGRVKMGGAGNKSDDLTSCTNKAKGGATKYTGFRCCVDPK